MPQPADWIGRDLTAWDCERLAIEQISPAHRACEAALQRTKWFDYRMMLGAKATYLFAAHYVLAYRDCYAATRDKRGAESLCPFSPEDIFHSRELTSMWLARQAADSIGARYEFVLRFAMERFANRGWRHFPRPNQLYAEELVLDAADAWKVECAARLQFPRDPIFRGQNYVPGHPVQEAWHEWIVEQISRRPMPHLGLAQVVFKEKLMPEGVALAAFGPGVLERARHFGGLLT